jgi:hypothetical protein
MKPRRLIAANSKGAMGGSLALWPLAILLFFLASDCPAVDAFSESQRIVSQYKAVFASP